MPTSTLEEELKFSLELGHECGVIALNYQRGKKEALGAHEKPDRGGALTKADVELNDKIVEAIRTRFPNDAVLAEESSESSDRLERDRCWMIDPIDGTRDFINGDTSWAIHIGLTIEGRPQLGVVFEPASERVTWGITNGTQAGAWMRDATGERSVRVASTRMEHLRLMSSKSHSSPRIAHVVEALAIQPENHLRTGSTGVKISAIARADADLYIHPTPGTKLWDSCAPEAILVASGGVLTDMHGQLLPYTVPETGNTIGLVATASHLLEPTLDILRPAIGEWFPPTSTS